MIINKIKNNQIYQKKNLSFGSKMDDDTLKGVLLNRHIQKTCADGYEFDTLSASLLIPEKIPEKKQKEQKQKESGFDYKKTLKPIALAAGVTFATILGVSAVIAGYSKKCAQRSDIVVPPDMAMNMNILQEPQFALYRALIKPSGRNLFGFAGVCMMSGVTLAGKTLVDGACDVWTKKQKCDIEYDYKKNMVDIEKEAFSGKLDVVNKMLKNTSDYFKTVFSNKKENAFSGFLNFTGKEVPKENEKNKKTQKTNLKNAILGLAMLGGIIGVGALVMKNYKNSAKNFNTYIQKCDDTVIRLNIQQAVDKNDKEAAISELTNVMKRVVASREMIEKELSKIPNITNGEIQSATKNILASQIYAQPPEALGGISNKIQYYCYMDEARGHLYNWILHPDNPFNKYFFLGFSFIGGTGYFANKAAEVVKSVAVEKESKKNELNLQKNLVEVEVENFKAKKEAAINPLIDNFNLQMQKGNPKDELKEAAQNILIEIKKGPPYVYS